MIVNGALTTAAGSVRLRFNNDTGNNYNYQTLQGVGAVASASRTTGFDRIAAFHLPNGANLFGGGMILIPHYAGTANHKAVLTLGGEIENAVVVRSGRWANVAAITRIDVFEDDTFVANSIFLLCAVDERYLVEESNLSADGTVTFSAIPQTPGDLAVVGYCRTDRAAATDQVFSSINADTTDANYARQQLQGSGASTGAAAAADREIANVTGDTATANAFAAFTMSISQHANGVKQPHVLSISGFHEAIGPNSSVDVYSGRRANIAAYTSIAFTPKTGTNFKSGSLFSLYHVPKRLIAYKKLTADAPSITHTVPAGYEAIFPTTFTRSDEAAATDSAEASFNNDTTDANYDAQILTGDGSTVAAATSAASRQGAVVPAGSAGANVFGGGLMMIPAYRETDRHKHALSVDGASDDIVALRSKRWESTAAITEIDWTLAGGDNFEGN